MNKKLPCTDFCVCPPTCERTDSDPILEMFNYQKTNKEQCTHALTLIFLKFCKILNKRVYEYDLAFSKINN